jgi:hypothetical protein
MTHATKKATDESLLLVKNSVNPPGLQAYSVVRGQSNSYGHLSICTHTTLTVIVQAKWL